jgi:hypothetical protein
VGSLSADAARPEVAADPSSEPRGLTLDRVWALLPILVPALVWMLSRMVAVDLAYHIRAGELILHTRRIPNVDMFTFTIPGRPWFDQQWGAQVLLALIHRAGGWGTVSFVRAALIASAFGMVYLACRARGAGPRNASTLSLFGFVVSLQSLAMRPQLFAIVLFAISLWVLATRDRAPGRLWLLPVIAVAWANLHGSFFMAPLLVGLAWIADLLAGNTEGARRLISVGAATVLATFVTPFGPLVWKYAYQLTTNPAIRNNVTEWAPVTIGSFGGAAFFVTGIGVAVYLARRPEKTSWGDLLWLTVFFVLALPAVRGIVWWSLVAPVVVAGNVTRPRGSAAGGEGSTRTGSPTVNRVLVGVLVGALLVALPWWRAGTTTAMLSQAPIGLSNAAARTLAPGTRLFVSEPWASWFEYALPSIPVFTDPRIEIFPTAVWDDYSEIRIGGSRWQQILDRWQVQAVVVDRDDFSRLLAVMRGSPVWKAVYEDRDGVLFVRVQGSNAPS